MNAKKRQVQVLDILAAFEKALFSKIDDADTIARVLDKIQAWTSGQPYMTKLLCNYVMEHVAEIAAKKDASTIDTIVQQKIVAGWRNNSAANHLKKIEKALLNYSPRDSLLILYLQILQRGPLLQNHSLEQLVLLRTGLVSLEDDKLKVTHAIYASIFNEAWIEQQLPGLTKPVVVIKSAPRFAKTASTALAVRGEQSSPLAIATKLPFLRMTLLACALAALTALAFSYFQKDKTAPKTEGWSWSNQASPANTIERTEAAAETSPAVGQVTQLTLLGDSFSGYSTFRNADFQGVLKAAGIELDYTDEFDQTLRAEKLSKGKADLMVTTLDQFLQQQPKGKIIGLLDRTVGADAVVLNTKRYPSLTSLLDLKQLAQQAGAKGKKLSITYASDTPSEYLALVLDTKFDTFNLSDFELKPVADASEAWALMQDPKENVAIAVLWEPYVAQASQQGYSVVLSSHDAPNAIVDVLVASDQLIQSNPAILSDLLEKYYRRIDANARDAMQLQAQVAEDGDLPVADAATIINGINFFTATEANSWLKDGQLEKSISATAAILTLSDRLAAVPANVSSLYTEKFITEAADNTQALIDLVRADNPELADKLSGKRQSVTVATPLSPDQIQQADDIGNFQVRGQVSFDTNSAQLTEEGKQTLNLLSDELKEFNAQTIALRVMGHTSRTGDAKLNQDLSQQRASVVANHLKANGVTLNISPEGKGSSEPLPNVDPASADNQRTEIRLVRVNPAR
jgi:OmpA-OmpF porin, OOP family